MAAVLKKKQSTSQRKLAELSSIISPRQTAGGKPIVFSLWCIINPAGKTPKERLLNLQFTEIEARRTQDSWQRSIGAPVVVTRGNLTIGQTRQATRKK